MGIILLKGLFSGSLIYWLLQRDSLDISILWHLAHPFQLFLFLGLYLCLLLNNNLRWCLFLKAFDVRTTFKETFKLTLMGLFFNFMMLGGVGGDLVKGYYLFKHKKDKKLQAAFSIFFDRFAGFYTMLTLGLITLLLYLKYVLTQSHLTNLLLFVIVLFLIVSAFLMICFVPQFHKMCQNLLFKLPWNILNKGETLIYLKPSYFVKAMGLSLLSLALCIAFFMLSGLLMNFNVPFWIYLYAVPLSFVFMALPVSLGGIGVGQVAGLALFSWGLGQETQVGPATVSAFHLIGILWSLCGVVIYLQVKHDSKKEVS